MTKDKMKKNIVENDPMSLAPQSLGKAGAELWRTLMFELQLRQGRDLEMLAQICAATDRVEEFRKIIDRDGAVIQTKMGMKEHPLIRHEAVGRAFITRSLQRLKTDINPVGRPSRGFGVSWKDLPR
jgi:hypothetical protein